MSFGAFRGGGAKDRPAAAGQTQAQMLKRKHVEDLLTAYPSIKPVSADVLDLPLGTAGGTAPVALRIHIPERFPDAAPILQVYGDVTHPWLDDRGMVVGHPYLTRWTPTMELVRIVQQTLDNFSQNPPRPRAAPTPGLGTGIGGPFSAAGAGASFLVPGAGTQAAGPSPSTAATGPTGARSAPTSATMLPSAVTEVPAVLRPTAVPTAVPELQSLSRAELEALNSNDARYRAFLEKLPYYQSVLQAKADVVRANTDKAEHNLQYQPQIAALEVENRELRELQSIRRQEFDALAQRQLAVMRRSEPAALAQRLSAAADPLEAESDRLGDTLVRGDVSLRDKDGLQRYLAQRTRLALLRLKQERLAPGSVPR